MPTDIRTVWDETRARGDFALVPPGLLTGSELETAMLISLFSDRVAAADDEIPDGTGDPRGWWADREVPIGSRLWLLDRAKATNATLQRAYDFVTESLQWLIDDGVVERFEISVQWVRQGFLGVDITTYRPEGASRFSWVWVGFVPARQALAGGDAQLLTGQLLTQDGQPITTEDGQTIYL